MIDALDEVVDHIRGPAGGTVILEYGDYQCPYSRRAFSDIERAATRRGDVRFAFRHFPLVDIHPHAFAAAAAAEAAARQGRFWQMHELLFHRQNALEDEYLRRYAAKLGLDPARFDCDRSGAAVRERLRRDVETAADLVRGTPTIFIDGVRHRGSYDARSLQQAVTERAALT